MHAALSRPQIPISLAAGFTDNASLPVAEARAALNQISSTASTPRKVPERERRISDISAPASGLWR